MVSYPLTSVLLILGSLDFFVLWIYTRAFPFPNSQPFALGLNHTTSLLDSPSCKPPWSPLACDPMDCSQPCPSVHGIRQARILEWASIPFSRGSSWSRDQPGCPTLQADSLPSEPPGKPIFPFIQFFIAYWFLSSGEPWLMQGCSQAPCTLLMSPGFKSFLYIT